MSARCRLLSDLREPAGNDTEILGRPLRRHAGIQAAEGKQETSLPFELVREGCERDPQPLVLRELEPLRHHADDGMGLAVDQYAAAENIAIRLIARVPQLVAEEYDTRGIRLIVVGCESPSQDR